MQSPLCSVFPKGKTFARYLASPLPKKFRVKPSIFREPCLIPCGSVEMFIRLARGWWSGTLPLPKKFRVKPSIFREPCLIPCGSIEMFVRLARGWWSGTLPLPKKYRVQPSFFGSPAFIDSLIIWVICWCVHIYYFMYKFLCSTL